VRHTTRSAIVIILATLQGCAKDAPAPVVVAPPTKAHADKILQVRKLSPPTSAETSDHRMYPRVVRGADGKVYLSWIRKLAGQRHALEFARLEQDAFSDVRTVTTGRGWFVNWADFPSLAVADGTLAAHWLERNGRGRYSYGVRVACSTDEGATWRSPFWLHEDRQLTEHGFATLVPTDDGAFEAVWLDGRDLAKNGKMTLRTRRFDASGPQGPGVELDQQVCECCATDAGFSDGKLITVYRDNTEKGIRDISVARRVDGSWSAIASCADDGWKHPG
jgi:hypothetical protein